MADHWTVAPPGYEPPVVLSDEVRRQVEEDALAVDRGSTDPTTLKRLAEAYLLLSRDVEKSYVHRSVARRCLRLAYTQGLQRSKTVITGATLERLHAAYLKHLVDGSECKVIAPDIVGLIEAEIAETKEGK